jgi:phospholipase C
MVLLAASRADAQTASTVASNNSDTASDDRMAPDHIVVVIFENHSYADIIGNAAAPNFTALAAAGANFLASPTDPTGATTGSHALRHPSQPNYLEFYSGSSQGTVQDGRPGTSAEPFTVAPPFTTPNLGASLRNAGYSFATYSESLPFPGFDGDAATTVAGQNQYQRKHNPVANWVNDANPTGNFLPSPVNQPFTAFQAIGAGPGSFGRLPTVSFVVPNEQNDMHDGTIAQADAWLKTNILDTYLAWAQKNNSLLIVTFDEDGDNTPSNLIPTIFAGPMVRPGNYYEANLNLANPDLLSLTEPGIQTPTGTAMDHYNVLSTIEDFYGLAHIGGSINRPGVSDVFVPQTLPPPALSGISNIVVVMMENRSFDHFLGWLPGANGAQSGLVYYTSNNAGHATYPLGGGPGGAQDFRGCGLVDPNHSYSGGRVEYDNGACDGWLLPGANPSDTFSIGYYQQPDLGFLGQAAPAWTVCDNYYAAIMAETYPNRFLQHAAQTDRITNSMATSTLPTIWDRLAGAGCTRRYYFVDASFLALWGTKYLDISKPYSTFLTDCQTGNLPNVSFIDPKFLDEDTGTSADDHPHADIRDGEQFLNQIYNAIRTSPNWPSTVLVINFDEWGGFYDHVPPPVRLPVPAIQAVAGDLDGRIGFRVPCVIISPFARRGHVAKRQFDHTSALKMIEWRFGLAPLTERDRDANNLATALDFNHPNLATGAYAVPSGYVSPPCLPSGTAAEPEFDQLRALASQLGFPKF